MLFQQAEDILADHIGRDFRRIGQAVTHFCGQFESVFKRESGVE